MTTKPPSAVNPAATDSQERLAYDSVAAVETLEPNDRARLGYHVWRWLSHRNGTLTDQVRESGVRLTMPVDEAVKLIREHLASKGVTAP
jgi:hypothetical protein